MEQQVYLNGELVPISQARISLLDYGFLFAYALFETMRAYSGEIFKLERHLERLAGSAAVLELPVERERWQEGIRAVLQANTLKEARVRLVLSAGPGDLVPDLATCTHPTLCVLAVPYKPPSADIYEHGYSVITSSLRRNSYSPLPGFKTSNFLESLLARREARRVGADDALLLNDRGLVAEASSSNVFVVRDGRLLTPRLGSGLLPGVTRGVILELAAERGIPAAEVDLRPEDLSEAAEIFISNSIIEIMPVTKLNGRQIGTGQAGPLSLELTDAYRRAVQGS
jgi:branched-chain amino acid aminotransferase